MKIETFKLSDLTPAEYNPRAIKPEALEGLSKSIEKFGYIQPIIVNTHNGEKRIVGGHQRLKAMLAQGTTSAKCVVVDFDPVTEKAANVALNAETISGDWTEGLESLLEELKVEFPDFEEVNLDELAESLDIDLDSLGDSEPGGDKEADNVPEIPDSSVIKSGDLIELGAHRVLCGDSTKAEDVERLMGGEKADMVFTDPPYGVSYADKNEFLNQQDGGGRNEKHIKNDHMTTEETGELWAKTFQVWAPFHAEYSSFYVCAPQGGDLFLMMMMMMNENCHPLRHTIIWAKNNHVLGRSDYNYKHEPILYGWQHKHKFYGKGAHKFSVWEVDKPLKNDLHPTMKPVELVENAVLNSSLGGMIVADYFLGAGSTVIACEKTDRRCFGIEIDPHYCQVIVQRWADYTGKDEIRINGKEVLWSEYGR